MEITLRKLLRNDSWSALESELMFTSKSMDQYQKEFDDFYNKFEPSYNDVKEYIQQKEYMKKLDPCMLSGFRELQQSALSLQRPLPCVPTLRLSLF